MYCKIIHCRISMEPMLMRVKVFFHQVYYLTLILLIQKGMGHYKSGMHSQV